MGKSTTKRKAESNGQSPQQPQIMPWAMAAKEIKVRKSELQSLYLVSQLLGKETRERVGLLMKIPVFIQDPLVALQNPGLGVQEIVVRLDAGLGDGPTSARIAVVDFDGDHQTLIDPVEYEEKTGWFYTPEKRPLPAAPPGLGVDDEDADQHRSEHRTFVEEAIKNPYFHQVNVWAVVQRVLEFYEDPQVLGRPVPWGFDGNRLLVVPHAGYGENAYYDQSTKSLQFYYFGDEGQPRFTCLSHDIIAHETGHAILDGIRPLYNENPSVQTAAFHEFIGDMTAILMGLFNRDIRYQFMDQFDTDNSLSQIAEEFGHEVEGRPYLRSASNQQTMSDVRESLSAHTVSEVLTGAMFDILIAITRKFMPTPHEKASGAAPSGEFSGNGMSAAREHTKKQAIWKAATHFRRIALQPLDLCPPCDIQFIDYARAVIRNDILTNPVDPQGFRKIMLQVFHDRKLCECGYQPKKHDRLPERCEFREAFFPRRLDFVYHDMGRVSRSTTAAYYFLNDNRKALRIPAHQDISIVGLYDNLKLGDDGERLPRQIVIEYVWKEQLEFRDDPRHGITYGWLTGKKVSMYCGGTLVFDDRGNLLSWFHKPGTELPAYKAEGDERKEATLRLYHRWLEGNRIRLVDQASKGLPREMLRPVTAREENGVLHFTTTPHLRKEDRDLEASAWSTNF